MLMKAAGITAGRSSKPLHRKAATKNKRSSNNYNKKKTNGKTRGATTTKGSSSSSSSGDIRSEEGGAGESARRLFLKVFHESSGEGGGSRAHGTSVGRMVVAREGQCKVIDDKQLDSSNSTSSNLMIALLSLLWKVHIPAPTIALLPF